MEVNQKIVIIFLSIVFSMTSLVVAVLPVVAEEVLIWDEYVLGTGGEKTSPTLEYGEVYRIVAEEVWWYNWDNNLAADAQYYTTSSLDSWDWVNYFPAPDGHSFLQINGEDVNWGPFSNGSTGHRYTIYYTGEGTPLTFRIVDWIDGNYANNGCKIRVRIYKPVTVGGYVVDTEPLDYVQVIAIGIVMFVALTSLSIINHRRKATCR